MTIRLMEILEEMRRAINCNQEAISELKKSCKEPKNCLVLRAQFGMTYKNMKDYHDNFERQMKTGVVVIPHYFDVIYVPEGVEVRTEAEDETRNI